MWVYRHVEGVGYMVGYYEPEGTWYTDEIFPGAFQARRRVCYLNGGGSQ